MPRAALNSQPSASAPTHPPCVGVQRNGYLFFPAQLDPALVRAARDRWWECVPEGLGLSKDEPDSWLGGFAGAEPAALERHRARTEEHALNSAVGTAESNVAGGLGW